MRILYLIIGFLLCAPSAGFAATSGAPTILDGAIESYARSAAQIDLIEADFADRAQYGVLLTHGDALIESRPRDMRTRHLVAAARAANGDLDGARSALAGSETDDDWRAIAEALLARRAGDLAEALRRARDAAALNPENAYAANTLGSVLVRQGDLDSALDQFETARRLAPEGATYAANAAAILRAQGDLGGAAKAIRAAIAAEPENCDALGLGAEIALAIRLPAVALDHAERCLAATPDDQRSANSRIQALIALRRFSDAAAALDEAELPRDQTARLQFDLALGRGDASAALDVAEAGNIEAAAPLRLVLAYLMAAEIDAARTTLEQAPPTLGDARAVLSAVIDTLAGAPAASIPDLAAQPGWASVSAFVAAMNAARVGEADIGAAALDRAAGIVRDFDPAGLPPGEIGALAGSDATGSMALGVLLAQANLLLPARDAFAEAASQAPDQALPRYFEAALSTELGETQHAVSLLESVVEAAPDFQSAHVLLGRLAAGDGRMAEALRHFEAAYAVSRTTLNALRVGSVAEASGDIARAVSAYENAIAHAPDSFVAYNQLAWMLVSNGGDLDRAEDLARRAAELAPQDPRVLDTLGWTLFRKGDAVAALTPLRAAEELADGQFPQITLHLATAEAEAGDRDRALALVEPLLTFDTPVGDDARALRDAIAQ